MTRKSSNLRLLRIWNKNFYLSQFALRVVLLPYEVPAMQCISCKSANEREFPAEINVHFPGPEGLDKPTVWIFPHLRVCLDCGLTQFTMNEEQVQQLANCDVHSQSRGTAA